MTAPKKIGILLSGRGSNFEAIADSIATGRLHAEVAIVISNKADAPGLESAKRRGLNAKLIVSKGRTREEHDAEVVAALRDAKVDLICLAGYMRLLSPEFVQAFAHPNNLQRRTNGVRKMLGHSRHQCVRVSQMEHHRGEHITVIDEVAGFAHRHPSPLT